MFPSILFPSRYLFYLNALDTFHQNFHLFYSEFSVDWELWLYGKEMPENKPSFDESAVKPCLDLAKRWQDWKPSQDSPTIKDFKNLKTLQKLVYLSTLFEEKPLAKETIGKMVEVHKIDEENDHVKALFYMIAAKAGIEKVFGEMIKFIKEKGPHEPMLVAPLLKMLLSWDGKKKEVMKMMEEMKNGKSLFRIMNFHDQEV